MKHYAPLAFIPVILLAIWLWPSPEPVPQPELLLGSDSGALSAGTGSDDSAVGTLTWLSTENIVSSNNIDATASTFSGSRVSTHYLKAGTFGFSIPGGATINGILVEIERRENNGGADVLDEVVSLVKADGTISATNKAATVTEWPTSDAYATYGGASDVWGETWTATDINDADFGVALSVGLKAVIPDDTNGLARVDHIRITVYYTEATPGNQVQVNGGSVRVNGGTVIVR